FDPADATGLAPAAIVANSPRRQEPPTRQTAPRTIRRSIAACLDSRNGRCPVGSVRLEKYSFSLLGQFTRMRYPQEGFAGNYGLRPDACPCRKHARGLHSEILPHAAPPRECGSRPARYHRGGQTTTRCELA